MNTNSFRFSGKVIFPVFFFFISIYATTGQSIIQGQVIDEEGQPLMLANVLLLDAADSSLVKGMITEEDGSFLLKHGTAGKYLVSFAMIGYRTFYSSVIEVDGAGDFDMGTTNLEVDVAQLEEVEVRARKPLFEQQIDRMVVNVENSITSAGSSALEVLERSPGVVVNRSNYAVSMRGKEGVIVMINGKSSRIDQSAVVQMLAGMNADNIEKIELITTPPASFDAEGDAGVINIILKKNTNEGTNGSYSFTGGYNGRETANASLNFNHRQGKVNLFGNYSLLHNRARQSFTNFRVLELQGHTETTNTLTDRDPSRNVHTARLGVDFQLSDQTVLGVLASGYDNKWTMDAVNDVVTGINGRTDSQIEIINDEINHWQHLMGNLNLRHTFSDQQQLSLDLDYLYYTDDNPTNYTNNFMDPEGNFLFSERLRSGKVTPINIWVGRIDYEASLGEKVNLEAGLKGTRSTFENDVEVATLQGNSWIADPDLTNDFDLDEKIGAAYTSFHIQAGEQTTVKAGLRFEFTDTYLSSVETQGIVDREFGSLFPSIFVSHNLNENNNLSFSYSRRITRPTFNEMAPFIIFMDPNTFFAGNESLRSAFTDAVKADYRLKNVIFSLQYSYDKNAIARFQSRIDPATNRQIFASENLDNRNTYSATLTAPVYVAKWWEMQNTATATYQKTTTNFGENDVPLELEQTSYRFNSVQSFLLPKKFTLEVSGFYQSPVLWGIMKMKSMSALNFGIQKELGNNWGTLRFSIFNIFETMDWRMTIDQPGLNLDIENTFVYLPRAYSITFTRNFGNQKLKKGGSRSTASEEEQQRIGN